MQKILLMGLALCAFAGPALADKAAYCQAYARDFSDQAATDKAMWQHKFQISLDACLAHGKLAAEVSVPIKPVPIKVVPIKPVPIKPVPIKLVPIKSASTEPVPTKPVPAKVVISKAAPKPEKPDVAKPASKALVAGTPEWNSYCGQKYTSFVPKTGMYRSNTGVARQCMVTADFKG